MFYTVYGKTYRSQNEWRSISSICSRTLWQHHIFRAIDEGASIHCSFDNNESGFPSRWRIAIAENCSSDFVMLHEGTDNKTKKHMSSGSQFAWLDAGMDMGSEQRQSGKRDDSKEARKELEVGYEVAALQPWNGSFLLAGDFLQRHNFRKKRLKHPALSTVYVLTLLSVITPAILGTSAFVQPHASTHNNILNSPINDALSIRRIGRRKGPHFYPASPAQRIRKCARSKSSLPAWMTSTMSAMHSDPTFVLTAILWLSTFGISLEKRTTVGKALSAPLATMALALIVANLGLIPFSSPIYTMTNKYLIPLAVPMLLFDSDLKRVVTDTGSLLLCFGVGAVATAIGTLLAFPLLPLTSLGPDVGWRVACALAARHIGGAINFVAVAETLNIGGSAVSAAIAADNVVVALYFAFLFAMSKEGEEGDNLEDNETKSTEVSLTGVNANEASNVSLSTLGIAISVASTLVACGRGLTNWILPKGTSALPMISVLTVIGATLQPTFFSRIRSSGTALGVIFIQMFFAASGAAGSLKVVLQQAPSLFLFSALQIIIHYLMLVSLGRGLFRLPYRELYLASNANVGGPTTAAAMAQAKNWKRLVLPALLVGILGYATATGIALALGPILLRLPILSR